MILSSIFGHDREPTSDFWYTPIGEQTASGIRVSEDTALRNTAVYSCVRILSETIASLPLDVYRDTNGNKQKLKDHNLHEILHNTPNHFQTSCEFRDTLQSHTGLRGNGYARIEWSGSGVVNALYPLPTNRVIPKFTDNGRLVYQVKDEQGLVVDQIPANEIFHLKGMSFDGLEGLSPVALHRETIGASFAAQEYGSRLFSNDATPRGILEHPTGFKDKEAFNRFRRSWQDQQTGTNRHKTAVLEDGMKYTEIGMSNEDAQFLETRKYSVTDIARIFRIPPHMIGDLDRSTNNNIEHQGIEFVVHTIRPWLVRWEQAIKKALIVEDDVFVEFNVDGLLRGDMKSRYEAYRSGIESGHLTRNEARSLENRNSIDGLDEPLTPMNMQQGKNNDDREAKLIEMSALRIARKEQAILSKGLEKGYLTDVERFHDWFSGVFNQHAKHIAETLCIDEKTAKSDIINLKSQLIESKDLNLSIDTWETSRVVELVNLVKSDV